MELLSPGLDAHQLDPLRSSYDLLFSDEPGAWCEVLVLEDAGLEGRPVLGHQDVLEGAVGSGDGVVEAGGVEAEHLAHVLGLATVVLLAVGVANPRVRLHYDPRLCTVDPGLPRTLPGHDLPVFQLLCVLPEVPDVAVRILGVPVEGVFDQLSFEEDPVPENGALHAEHLS